MHPALRLQVARHRLGRANGHDFVEAAGAAVVDGAESPTLILLAGESDPILSDALPMFLAALGELGFALPDLDESNWIVIRHHLTRIAEGAVEPVEGMRELLKEVDRDLLVGGAGSYLGGAYGIEGMIGLYYGIDDLLDRPHEVSLDGVFGEAAIPLVERYMRAEAVEWLEKNRR